MQINSLQMNRLINFLLAGSVLLHLLAGCRQLSSNTLAGIDKGKVIPVVKCNSDTLVNYALYIPSSYDSHKKWPLIIAFDPHAAGSMPVNLLHEEAERRGYLVAGSNNSKNGMEFSDVRMIYRILLDDITSRFEVDTALIYLIGFSGGGRVASSLAWTEGGVAGVISCGAGLSSNGQPPKHSFSFLGIAGTADFNRAELSSLDPELEKAGFIHHFIEFEGGHEWPPRDIVTGIFDWIGFDAMRTGKIPTNRSAVNRFIDRNDSLANSPSLAGDPYEQWKVYVKMKHFLQGLTDITALDGIVNQLEKDSSVIQKQKEAEDQLKLEESLRQKYSGLLREPDPDFWKTESARLKSLAEKRSADSKPQVYKRILGFLSLSAYMYSSKSLKQNDLEAAQKYVEIYRLVDPGNSEHRYLAAVIAARKHNREEVLKALAAARELGFKDKARLLADPDFSDSKSDPEFEAIVNQL